MNTRPPIQTLFHARKGRVGQGRAGQGRAGQGRAGQGRAEQGRAGQGRVGLVWYPASPTLCLVHKDALGPDKGKVG